MSNMKKMFSVGVSLFNVQNLNNDELKKHIHERYKIPAKHENFDSDILNNLKNAFLTEGQNYAKELFGSEKNVNLKINKIWGNTHIDQSIGVPHNHRSSLISAVYYLTKGKLTFLNPYQLLLSHVHKKDIVKYNDLNCDLWTCDMKEGDMVIFNSGLQHYAHYDGKDKHERMSIACDMVKTYD
ncbi:hypothetical protein CMO86_03405 [Candidatus Woesearchaeota archaeon]|nr:hypothetical protein [Candidatus Woesearchaeota archaeon]|tara:strand:- start:1296 stop:1844 length:549 start_codon:yes stop_codon:yes gene_type:complete